MKEPCKSESLRKIFLSRRNTYRRPYNDTEVEDLAKSMGYEIINTGTLSIKEQAELFHSADIIVAPTGASLTNVLFCRPKTKVIVLSGLAHVTFVDLALNLGVDLSLFVGKMQNEKDIHSAFTIPIEKLRAYLKEIESA